MCTYGLPMTSRMSDALEAARLQQAAEARRPRQARRPVPYGVQIPDYLKGSGDLKEVVRFLASQQVLLAGDSLEQSTKRLEGLKLYGSVNKIEFDAIVRFIKESPSAAELIIKGAVKSTVGAGMVAVAPLTGFGAIPIGLIGTTMVGRGAVDVVRGTVGSTGDFLDDSLGNAAQDLVGAAITGA
jgi:hypothetical protein